jgi:DNA-binding transcriptional regulator YiaG
VTNDLAALKRSRFLMKPREQQIAAASARVRRIRASLGVTQEVLAVMLDVSANTVRSWEQGLKHPNYDSIVKLETMERQHEKESSRQSQGG